MSDCTGCFDGCAEVYSDRCVKYTGPDISALGIETGQTLSMIEEKITDYLLTVMDGSGIVPVLPESICALISDNLPAEGDITLNDVIDAIISAACALQVQVDAVEAQLTALEGAYNVGACLTGVTSASGTHNILQAVINSLCAATQSITALQVALSTYVKIADINTYIQNYLDSLGSTKEYTKMVPYTVVEYYGSLVGKFDSTGAGYGDWEKIYLCNGNNGTPDKRGRIPIGATDNVGGGPYTDVEVDPSLPGNPHYDKLTKQGTNKVTLSIDHLPPHDHAATSTIVDPGHKHLFAGDNYYIANGGYIGHSEFPKSNIKPDSMNNNPAWHIYTKNTNDTNIPQTTGITVSTSIANKGGGVAHSNIPPVMGCYYIMYIP